MCCTQSEWSEMAGELLRNYTRQVFDATRHKGWDGTHYDDDRDVDKQWSFAGSLLFAITVITTIGNTTHKNDAAFDKLL